MSRLFYGACLTIIVTVMLVACSNSQDVMLPYGTYTLEASQDIIKPTIELGEDKKFIFVFSSLSSYIAYGAYEIKDNHLELKTDDEQYTYVFDIVDKTLVFDVESSSQTKGLTTILDGAIFK